MNAQRWREIRTAFDELVELGAEGRATRLSEIGAGDPDLRDAVASLLEADADSERNLAHFELGLLASDDEAATVRSPRDTADPFGLVGSAIAHFEVREWLGAGGMGVVYRAFDTRLNREVALKLPLPAALIGPSARARFLQEGRAAGALDHANLCTIFEAGEDASGQLYLAMALYSGDTLQTRLKKDVPLPIDAALEIVHQMARGVAAAHEAGIVHRDLKPGNLMLLPDGTVKILDFGLAKVTDLSLTGSRSQVGTVAYMAPEQIRGRPVDGRTDLWAIGVMLYEMLTGRRPFDGEHDISIAHAIVHADPVLPSDLRAGIPFEVEDLILELLRKDPAKRMATAAAVVSRVATIRAGLDSATPRLLPHRARLAMRRVRNRSRRLVRRPIFLGAVGLIAFVLASAELLGGAGGEGREGAGSVDVPSGRPFTAVGRARELYVRGREYERRVASQENVRAAASLYQRALELDSGFAQARARLAVAHATMYGSGYDRALARRELARTEAEAALRGYSGLPDAHLALGYYWLYGHGDDDRALREFTRALSGMPNSSELLAAIARIDRGHGRWDEAAAGFARAFTLDSQNLSVAADLALTYSTVRRYADAVRIWDHVIELAPENHNAKLSKGYVFMRLAGTVDTLAAALHRIPADWDPEGAGTLARTVVPWSQGRHADAIAVLEATRSIRTAKSVLFRPTALMRAQIREDAGDTAGARADYHAVLRLLDDSVAADPDDARLLVPRGLAYAGLQRTDDAIREARRIVELSAANVFLGPGFLAGAAEILARSGDIDGALAILDRLLGTPAGIVASVPLLRVDPSWRALRHDPRFERLLLRHTGT